MTKRGLIHTLLTGQENEKNMSEASSPASWNTNLAFSQSPREDGSFRIFNNHNKYYFQHPLLNSDTASSLPHILTGSQFPSTSPLKWFVLFQPPPCLSSSERSLLPWTGKNNYIKRTTASWIKWKFASFMEKQVYEWPAFEFKHWMENQDTSQEILARFCYYLW